MALLARGLARFDRAILCLLCVGIALGLRASAAAQPALLSWQAPPSCGSKAAIELKIRQLLGEGPAAPSQPVRAQVRIEKTRGRYQLRLVLEIGTHRAERRLHGASCEELGETVAWMIALAINPELSAPSEGEHAPGDTAQDVPEEAAAETTGARRAQASDAASSAAARSAQGAKTNPEQRNAESARERESEAEPSRKRLTIVSRSSASESARALQAGASAGVFAGGPSGVQAALGAFAGISVGWSYTQARLSGLLPRRIDIAPGADANIWSLMLDLTQCALWGQAIRAGPCISLAGLRTAAQVRGLTQPTHQAALWANTGAGIQLFWRLAQHLELSLSVSAGIPVSPRPRFIVQGVGPIVTAKAWSSDARLGLSFATN